MNDNMNGSGMNTYGGGKRCTCRHHRIKPICIFLIGLAFLLAKFNVLTMEAVSWIWPILVIVIGGTKTFEYKCKCC